MHLRGHNYRTAWLGLLAMSLLVLAPLVSQWLCATRTVEATGPGYICSAAPTAADEHHRHLPQPACGYCDLLADQAAAGPPVAILVPVILLVIWFAGASLPRLGAVPRGNFPSGRPRGPPSPGFVLPFSF